MERTHMHDLLHTICENVKKLEPFTRRVLENGLLLTAGLIAMAVLFDTMAGRFGNIIAVLSCAKGAKDAAVSVLGTTIIGAFLSDVILKDRAGRD